VGLNGKGSSVDLRPVYPHRAGLARRGKLLNNLLECVDPFKLASVAAAWGAPRAGRQQDGPVRPVRPRKDGGLHDPASDGLALPASWVLPVDFDPAKKYPVLISIYGGPLSAGLRTDGEDCRTSGWPRKDNPAFGGPSWIGRIRKQGAALMHRRLGYWEMRDYGDAALWLKRQPFVDTSRVCITGGSYGGYVTCLASPPGPGCSRTAWRSSQ